MTIRLAIVLSGGGAKGAFQVGVLDALINIHGVRPSIVVGTSTGAIQALGVAQDDIDGLKDVWLQIKGNRDIYRDRGGIAGSILLGEKALYDATPLRRLLKKFADPAKLSASPIDMRLGVVSLQSGESGRSTRRSPIFTTGSMPVARCRSFSTRCKQATGSNGWMAGCAT